MSEAEPELSILLPVYHEEENVGQAIETIATNVRTAYELLVVYDSESDPTVAVVERIRAADARVRLVRNRFGAGRGLLNAIRTGIAEARGDALLVTMADNTDDIAAVDRMVSLHREGNVVVSATRHSRGGSMSGGPFMKGFLSRWGGITLHWLTGLPTSDPTNAFKLWDAAFVRRTPIETTGGFEYSLELCAKAYAAGERIVEIPTAWREREVGTSKFQLWKWLPRYVRWYAWLVRRTWADRLLRRRR